MPQVNAIVGHGRSPEGKGWADVIDSCDVVVRMWDWTWQDECDYGAKYDFGFYEIQDALITAFKKHNKAWPKYGWVASLLGFTKQDLPEKTEIISQAVWAFEGRRLGGVGATGNLEYTRGTIAALWLIARSAPGDIVMLVGYDSVLAGKQLALDKAFSRKYRANPGTMSFNGYKDNAVKYGNHDFAIERPVMQMMAKRHGVILKFAQQEWPCSRL